MVVLTREMVYADSATHDFTTGCPRSQNSKMTKQSFTDQKWFLSGSAVDKFAVLGHFWSVKDRFVVLSFLDLEDNLMDFKILNSKRNQQRLRQSP